MTPHKCPVCDGWGDRHDYQGRALPELSTDVTVTAPLVECTVCKGEGVLWKDAPLSIPSAFSIGGDSIVGTVVTYQDSTTVSGTSQVAINPPYGPMVGSKTG